MSVRPFKFKLKQVGASDNDLLAALYRLVPQSPDGRDLHSLMVEALRVHVDRSIELSFEAVHRDDFATSTSKLSESATLAVFCVDPINRKAVCEIDNSLAVLVVEKILGSASPNLPDLRKLSDTELGVLQYLLLNLLAAVYKTMGDEPKVRFRFDRFAESSRHLADVANGEDASVMLVFRLMVGRHSGYVRLLLSDPFVEEAFLNMADEIDQLSPGEIQHKIDRLSAFGYIDTVLWAEAGATVLSPAELGGIEAGDIVILDSTTLNLKDDKITGQVRLRVGGGNQGAFEAEVSANEHSAICEITGFNEGE